MTAVAPLLLAAAVVGILHMSAPDHWVTLCLLGRSSRWSRGRLLSVSAVTAAGHVGLSVLLGFVIVELGLIFSEVVSGYLTEGTGVVMIAGGLYHGVKTLLSHQKEDYEVEAEEEKAKIETGRSVRYFAVLGGALSPDLSILPIFLLAVSAGTGVEISIALTFAAASILSLLLLVVAGSAGLSRVFERVPPKYNDALVGFVIAGVGAYILIAG